MVDESFRPYIYLFNVETQEGVIVDISKISWIARKKHPDRFIIRLDNADKITCNYSADMQRYFFERTYFFADDDEQHARIEND